jgi:hypothetical protein
MIYIIIIIFLVHEIYILTFAAELLYDAFNHGQDFSILFYL